MSKTKSTSKATKPSRSDVLAKAKDSGVTKPSKDVKSKSTEVAKKVSGKDEMKSKKSKKVKEPTPEPSSSEEEAVAESSESDSSDSETESKVEIKKPAANGTKKSAPKEDSSDSSDASESSEDEAPAPKKGAEKKTVAKANGTKTPAKKEESSDESDSDDDEEVAPATGVLGAAPTVDEADSSDESDSSADEKTKPKASGAKVAAAASSDEDSEDSSDESSEDEKEEKPAAKAGKRKAEEEPERAQKKAKAEAADETAGSKNLFVGNLSWNVDEALLRETFEEHGALTGVRIMYDRETGRAKGFGYVEFANAADAAAAYETKKGFELDGRAMNVDYSKPKPDNSDRTDNRRKSYGDQLSEPSDTLFVGNISFDVGQEQVSEAFAPFGTIMSVRLPTDQTTGTPKGFGYVTFSSVEEAQAGLEGMQGGYVGSRPVRLDYSQPRPERSEGGFGGRGRGGDRGARGFGGRGRGGDRGRGGFGGRGRGGDRGRGGFGDRGRGRGASTNRGGFGDFSGTKVSFD